MGSRGSLSPFPPGILFFRFFGYCLLTGVLEVSLSFGQQATRYRDEIFPDVRINRDIQYGSDSELLLDLYTGVGDTASNRPAIVFIHGGGFISGDKVTRFGSRSCTWFAKRGYVVVSINYRLMKEIPNDTVHFEAMLRGMQDAKAAIRFMRRKAGTYRVDTTQIFAMGSSAGSIIALHLAYLDSTEVPLWVNWNVLGGTFEGARGNPGYSSAINGVINNWGAIGDTSWIQKGDVPVYCTHGEKDTVVSYNQVPADGPFRFGSKFIIQRAQTRQILHGLRVFPQTGHTLDNNASKQVSALNDMGTWLESLLLHRGHHPSMGESHRINTEKQGIHSRQQTSVEE